MGTQIHAGDNYRARGRADSVRHDRTGLHRSCLGGPGMGPAISRGGTEARRHRQRAKSPNRGITGRRKGFDWELWLGPAPERPFHEVYYPGPKWYRWWDFGNGTMSDLGSHWIDLPFWALKLRSPKTILAPSVRRRIRKFQRPPRCGCVLRI